MRRANAINSQSAGPLNGSIKVICGLPRRQAQGRMVIEVTARAAEGGSGTRTIEGWRLHGQGGTVPCLVEQGKRALTSTCQGMYGVILRVRDSKVENSEVVRETDPKASKICLERLLSLEGNALGRLVAAMHFRRRSGGCASPTVPMAGGEAGRAPAMETRRGRQSPMAMDRQQAQRLIGPRLPMPLGPLTD